MEPATDDQLVELEESLKEWFTKNHEGDKAYLVHDSACRHIAPALRRRALEEGLSVGQYRDRLLISLKLLQDLRFALHLRGQRARCLWRHETFDLLRSNDKTRGFVISKEGLTTCAAEYLKHPEIQANYFDWMLLDAMVFAELDAFGTGLNLAWVFAGGSYPKYYAFQVLFGLVGFALGYLVPPALAIYLASNDRDVLAAGVVGLWLLILILHLVSAPARWRAKKKSAKILTHLVDTYAILGADTISPRKLKESLDKGAEVGVVLDGAVYAIVDRMIARDPTALILTQV